MSAYEAVGDFMPRDEHDDALRAEIAPGHGGQFGMRRLAAVPFDQVDDGENEAWSDRWESVE